MPLMGIEVGGYQVLTISELIDEFRRNPHLLKKYSWVAVAPKSENLIVGAIKLSPAQKRKVVEMKATLRPYADMFVANSRRRNVTITRLSKEDLDLLATAVVFGAVIATDERALQLIVRDLMEDVDEYPIDVLCSMDVLGILEKEALLTREQRLTTVEAWIRLGERLPMTWRADYERNFGEPYD